MSKNAPAFPVIQESMEVPNGGPGLTKREYFAAAALGNLFSMEVPVTDERAAVDIARAAYQIADAMLTEGEKG